MPYPHNERAKQLDRAANIQQTLGTSAAAVYMRNRGWSIDAALWALAHTTLRPSRATSHVLQLPPLQWDATPGTKLAQREPAYVERRRNSERRSNWTAGYATPAPEGEWLIL
jgi:hypothetical protein